MNCLGDGGEGGVEADSRHQSQGGARHKARNIIDILEKISQILNFLTNHDLLYAKVIHGTNVAMKKLSKNEVSL